MHYGLFSSLDFGTFQFGTLIVGSNPFKKMLFILVLYSKIYVAWLASINFSASHRGSTNLLKEIQSTVSAPAIETLISLTCDHIPNEKNCINLSKIESHITSRLNKSVKRCSPRCLLLIVPAIDTLNSLLTSPFGCYGSKVKLFL